MNQLQLEKKSKELDAWEERLKAQSDFIKESNLTEKIIYAKLETAQNKLQATYDEIDKEIDLAYKELEEVRKDKAELESLTATLKDNILKRKAEYKTIKEAVSKAEDFLRQKKRQASDLDKYLIKQQKLIDDSVQQGNDRLIELQSISEELTAKIRDLKSDIIGLESEVTNMELEKSEIEQALDISREKFKQEETVKKAEIAKLDKQIKSKHRTLSNITLRLANADKEFKQREESIKAKTDYLIEENKKLRTEKRRWQSIKELNTV